MNNIQRAIIATLSYSHLFEYPLTSTEIHRYLIGITCDLASLRKELTRMNLFSHHGYYTFCDTSRNIRKRIQRERISKAKMYKAKRIAKILSFLPTVQLIGVSGSLSMKNCKKDDDIDLFFITSANSVWLTRFCVSLLLILLGEKRKRLIACAKDKICPNMYLSNDTLTLSKQNLYTAHEVAQLKVLHNKNRTYEQFLYQNNWIHTYLPNITITQTPPQAKKKKWFGGLITVVDTLFFFMQKSYMRKYQTIEKIGQSYALFHPQDKATIGMLHSYETSKRLTFPSTISRSTRLQNRNQKGYFLT
jgi:hypothetical protein